MTTESDNGPAPDNIPPDEPVQTPANKVPPVASAQGPLVSVVIPCCGQLEYTRLCVPSLRRHSRSPVELIFVDVGSLDGTAEFLDGVAAAAPMRVQVMHVQNEEAFQTACQAGMDKARGEFVVWLNNDTIVTNAWLNQLVALSSTNATLGIVGPMANYAPKAQQVPTVPYRLTMPKRDATDPQSGLAMEPLERFAQKWRQEHKGKWFEIDRLGGFCLCFRREVLQRIRLFDDKTEPGVFDADAICWKARQAGYRCAVCGDLYIHHFGSRIVAKG